MQGRFMVCSIVVGVISLALSGCGSGSSLTSTSSAPPPSVSNQWTWIHGAEGPNNAIGSYGKAASLANTPGARDYPVTWTDASGNFWLFGGYGYATASSIQGDLNDLWEFNNTSGWKWVSGSNQTEQAGVCGSEGVSSTTNMPGARYQAASWVDSSGTFWLFGGLGIDCSGTRGKLNDLWRYSAGEWTFMSGSPKVVSVLGAGSVYGTKGIAAPSNTPGARVSASSWIDADGSLWLFGGAGPDSTGTFGSLDDLWKYSNGEWAWMGGSTLEGAFGVYGTQGVAAASNMPGGRWGAMTWMDSSGTLWVFGGDGNGNQCAETGPPCEFNDLWKYSNGEWTWMSGSEKVNEAGSYGTISSAAPSNSPGGRNSGVSWIDSSGNLWLFGGYGIDSENVLGDLNDLWEYNNGKWVWVGGSDQASQSGTYGTQGTASTANIPGPRKAGVSWRDASGYLWLFGGDNLDSVDPSGKYNDLWKYQP